MLPGQLNIFDAIEAQRRRDEGMQRAAEHSPKFQDVAYAALERIAKRQIHIHCDDLLAELGSLRPHHPNAFGAVWMRAIRAGLIQRTNQVRKSKDPLKHAHSYPLYFSRVYIPGAPS